VASSRDQNDAHQLANEMILIAFRMAKGAWRLHRYPLAKCARPLCCLLLGRCGRGRGGSSAFEGSRVLSSAFLARG
jgi:hypothetical protein